MNILKLLDKYAIGDGEPKATTPAATSRRDAFKHLGNLTKDIAMVALPLGGMLMAPTKAAFAQSTRSAVDVLNFALTLEYLEAEFYETGLSSTGLVSAGKNKSIIEQISKHETAHVALLTKAITDAGGTPVPKPTFDFTAGGTFSDVFSNETTFLEVAQALEDTGVRAYKGQAGFLKGTDTLTVALQIHSVEARHASEIRRLRGSKGWIIGSTNTTAPAADPVYAGEGNLTHLGIDVSTLGTGISNNDLTAAWDEPLTTDETNTIASLFL